jgi:soluble lytic murein transglycosylase-like protein
MASLARRVLVLVVVALLSAVVVIALFSGDTGNPRLAPGTGADNDPLAYTAGREAAFAAAAARGHAHVIYAKSPGGARASAERVARYRPLVEAAAETADIEPDTLEAMVLLESAGRPDAVADPQLEGAVGLTQILAETGRNLLKMKVDPAGARRIGRSLRRAAGKGDSALMARLRARRRAIDERFDPPKALAATARYLTIAKQELGRTDLAVVSYHMGIGNVQSALRDYGEDDISYARLYFDSTPTNHAAAYRRLAALGDDSATYLWRVMAAREIMRLYRSDPDQLDRVSALQTAKNSAEEVLHPGDETDQFSEPSQLRAAYADHRIAALPRARLLERGIAIDRGMGELAGRLGQRKTLYRGLREPALALLAYIGAGTEAISGDGPLVVTSTVRDERYQRQLLRHNREATPNYSLHTTGWAFDILRAYASRAQALAFEFFLERLQSYNLIAWVREPAAIHVTVSQDARRLAAVLNP